jgi:hypothetical protein
MNETVNEGVAASITHALECWKVILRPTSMKGVRLIACPAMVIPADETARFRKHVIAELARRHEYDEVELDDDRSQMRFARLSNRVLKCNQDFCNGTPPHGHTAVGSIRLFVHNVDDELAGLVVERMRNDASIRGLMDAIWDLVSTNVLPEQYMESLNSNGIWHVEDAYRTEQINIKLYCQERTPYLTEDIIIDYVAMHPSWLPQ